MPVNNISILPPSIKAQHIKRQKQTILFGIGFLILGLFLIFSGFLFISTLLANAELKSIRAQMEVVNSHINENRDYIEMKNKIDDLEARVIKAMGSVPEWNVLLARMGMIIPNETWITSISAKYDGESNELLITGRSVNQVNMLELFDSISTVKEINDAKCRFSVVTDENGRSLMEFEIKALLPEGPEFEMLLEEEHNDR